MIFVLRFFLFKKSSLKKIILLKKNRDTKQNKFEKKNLEVIFYQIKKMYIILQVSKI